MRDTIFKAKRIDNGEWVEGYLTARKYSGTDTVLEAYIIIDAYVQLGVLNFGSRGGLVSECEYDCFKVDPETVCQYTGLTGKNGKKIWENDIVKASYLCGIKQKDEIGTVEWLNGAFCFKHNDEEYGRHFLGYVNDAEVIGNIIDNSELLTVHEDEKTHIISMNSTINMQEVELRLCRTEIGKLQRKVIDLEKENLSLKTALNC